MSFLTTKNVDTTEKAFISSFVSFGINKLKITGINVVKNGDGKYKVTFRVETPPITVDGFKSVDNALGQVGNVGLFLDVNDEKSITSIGVIVGTIADKLGVRDQVNSIASPDPEDYFKALAAIICNGTYLWYVLGAKEYSPGKFGLKFVKFNWCKAEKEVDESSLVTKGNTNVSVNLVGQGALFFDENNEYHLKRFVEPVADKDAFPFAKPADTRPSFVTK